MIFLTLLTAFVQKAKALTPRPQLLPHYRLKHYSSFIVNFIVSKLIECITQLNQDAFVFSYLFIYSYLLLCTATQLNTFAIQIMQSDA